MQDHVRELVEVKEAMGTLTRDLEKLRRRVATLRKQGSLSALVGGVFGSLLGAVGIVGAAGFTGYFQKESTSINADIEKHNAKMKAEKDSRVLFFENMHAVADPSTDMTERLNRLLILEATATEPQQVSMIRQTIDAWAGSLCGEFCGAEGSPNHQRCETACEGIAGLGTKIRKCDAKNSALSTTCFTSIWKGESDAGPGEGSTGAAH